jgi:hypothetical protein
MLADRSSHPPPQAVSISRESFVMTTLEKAQKFCSELGDLSQRYGIEIVNHGKYGIELRETSFPPRYMILTYDTSAMNAFPYRLIFGYTNAS